MRPDTATAQVLRHAHRQIERLLNDPAGDSGCRAGARGAVHALLAEAATAPTARPASACQRVRLAQWPLAVRAFGPLEVWVHGRPVSRLTSRPQPGGVLGGSGADYTLTIVAINDDCGGPVPELAPKGSPFCEEWSQADGWRPTGREFVKTSPGDQDGICRYEICIPHGLTGQFHYNVRLVSANFEVVSFARSNPFVLVPATPWPSQRDDC